ncbi:hypothetical protein MKX08_005391 [Trichoderma sp. CBMAI-0020]|nr:hypothetical protein MKX08_005391 [Trichoderma sp. CBMAI-0020]
MPISRPSESINREPVSLLILPLLDTPKPDIRAPLHPVHIANIPQTLPDLHEQLEIDRLLCGPAMDGARKHPSDIRRVRLDNTPPRSVVARDDFGLDDPQGLSQSLHLSPGPRLRKSRIQEGARVVGRPGAKVDAPGCSSSGGTRVLADTPNGQDEAVGIGVLFLDLQDAFGGIVDKELVVWDVAVKEFVRRVKVAAENLELATSTSIAGVSRHCPAAPPIYQPNLRSPPLESMFLAHQPKLPSPLAFSWKLMFPGGKEQRLKLSMITDQF